jgi:hypothetical protein
MSKFKIAIVISLPSWFLVADDDRMIVPETQNA